MNITHVAISPESDMSKYDNDELAWAVRHARQQEDRYGELRRAAQRELLRRTPVDDGL